MTSIVDLWRAIDPAARLAVGSAEKLLRPVRGVARTRAVAPHLPPAAGGSLLLVDGSLADDLPALLAAIAAAELDPVAVMIAGSTLRETEEPLHDPMPVLASGEPIAGLLAAAEEYLADEAAALARLSLEVRLACAEAALADPQPGAPAGLLATRLRRGVAVVEQGELRAVHARPAGNALAVRFAALHRRLLGRGTGELRTSQRRDGLWLLQRSIRPGASAWLFDDQPLAAVDEVGVDALRLILRALLQRPQPREQRQAGPPQRRPIAESAGVDDLRVTLLAVARANGRVLPAARALGVHRNTVLYRLRRAQRELGIDTRRPDDALRLLREMDGPTH